MRVWSTKNWMTAPSVFLYVQSRPSRTPSANRSSSAISRSASAAIPSAPSGIIGAPMPICYLDSADGLQPRPRRVNLWNLRAREQSVHSDAGLIGDDPCRVAYGDNGVVVEELIRA